MKTYKINILDTAKEDLREAKKWYTKQSIQASKNLTATFKKAKLSLKQNPYRTPQKQYLNTLILTPYPYQLCYFVDEDTKTVIITNVFQMNQDPDKFPTR